MAELLACRVEDLPPGTVRIVPGGRWGIGVFNCDGTFHALSNRCPHAGAPVCRGVVTGTTRAVGGHRLVWEREGEILRCPWHGWEFAIATGRSLTAPTRAIHALPVRVVDGKILVTVPDAATEAAHGRP